MSKTILVTGGNGYIGSHTVLALKRAGFLPVIIDDFSNSNQPYLQEIETVLSEKPIFYQTDFASSTKIKQIIDEVAPVGVIHFAAFKYVSESTENPSKYYENNVSGFVKLLNVLSKNNLPIVFSSSAAVYGEPSTNKVTEEEPANPQSPYGWSKYMDEVILQDFCKSKTPLKGIALRYFNVIGADSSGKIGETSTSQSQNLWPFVLKAATGEIDELTVYGGDYETPDGTCLRDYVHVSDLADAHVAALNHLLAQNQGYFDIFNVGTGKPASVLEFIKAFEEVTGQKLPYKIGPRRLGDPTAYYAANDKIKQNLGWQPQKTLAEAIKDAWHRYQVTSKD